MVSLQSCPPEVIEAIVQLLDQKSHLNLRLCSRELSFNAAQGTFKSYYHTKRVPLSNAGLDDFSRFCASTLVASCLQKLVLVGQVAETRAVERILREETRYVPSFSPEGWPEADRAQSCTEEDLEAVQIRSEQLQAIREERRVACSTGAHGDGLTTAFRLLREIGKLQSLQLDVEVFGEDEQTPKETTEMGEWREIWDVASHTWKTAVVSVARSGLAVEQLNVFFDTRRCSIDCKSLQVEDVDGEDLARCLATVKSAAISLSETPLPEADTELSEEEETAPLPVEEDFSGVSTVFHYLTAVEELKLRWYTIAHGAYRQVHPAVSSIVADHVFEAMDSRPLKRLDLRGFQVSDAATLLNFLQTTRPKILSLVSLYSRSGQFQSILDHVGSDQSNMDQLYLEDIQEHGQDGKFYFEDGEPMPYPQISVPGEPRPPPSFAIKRKGPNLRKPIKYRCSNARRRHLDSPTFRKWMLGREREYGPPDGRWARPRVH